jgi:hypothetical protein
MDLIVRAVDVGSGNTKYVTGISGADIRCASFPSVGAGPNVLSFGRLQNAEGLAAALA